MCASLIKEDGTLIIDYLYILIIYILRNIVKPGTFIFWDASRLFWLIKTFETEESTCIPKYDIYKTSLIRIFFNVNLTLYFSNFFSVDF